MRKRLLRGGLAAAIPVALGASFYLFLRAREAWFVTRALEAPTIGAPLRSLRASTLALATGMPSLVDDVAPDLLWAIAVGGMLRAIRGTRAWMIIGIASVLAYEIGQRWHLVPGTFDPKDLVAQAIGFAIGWRVLRVTSAEARTSTA